MSDVLKKVGAFLSDAFGKILTGAILIGGFLLWGYLHQLFSFADCGEGGHPDMSLGAIIASGFGMSTCDVPSSKRK